MPSPAPVGSVVGLYYDGIAEVEEGHVIQTRTRRCYRVVGVRRQERGKHTGRWHIRALVIDPDQVEPEDTVHPLYWYRRG